MIIKAKKDVIQQVTSKLQSSKIEKSNPNRDVLGRFTFGKQLSPDTGLGGGNSISDDVEHKDGFVLTRNGSKDFGEITKEFAKLIGRQSGKIRMQEGWHDNNTDKGSGEVHIERPKRMKQLNQVGYNNARDFVQNICDEYDAIYSSGMSLMLVKTKDLYTCVVELTPAEEDYYDVKTAYVSGRNNIKNKINKKKIRLVWSSPTSLDLSKSLIPYNSKSITSIPTGFIKGTFDNLILINSQNKSRKINKSLTFSGYKLQDRTTFNGLNISIENKKGSVRSGTDSNGHKWSIKMNYDYGYIRGTVGTDGDHLDCYLGDNEDAKNVYVIHQNNPDTDKYDEDKVMLGFKSLSAAKKAYLSQYDRPGFLEKSIPRVVTMLKKNQAQK